MKFEAKISIGVHIQQWLRIHTCSEMKFEAKISIGVHIQQWLRIHTPGAGN